MKEKAGVISEKHWPWLAALVSLLWYLATTSAGVTVNGWALTSVLAGWQPQPASTLPLFELLTAPLRWLPGACLPLALNLISGLCASATLGFLAATVALALKPRADSWQTKNRRPITLPGWWAVLPPGLGVAVAGLNVNFWLNATQATGEMWEVLFLAAALWCLFHFRATHKVLWLELAALVWGLGMTENWMMLVTAPLFAGVVLWQASQSYGEGRLLKLGLAGLAGFSAVVWAPLLNGLLGLCEVGAAQNLLLSLKARKFTIWQCYSGFWHGHAELPLMAMVFYALPLVSVVLRPGDVGTRLLGRLDKQQVWGLRALRTILLLGLLWFALEPTAGLRQVLQKSGGSNSSLVSYAFLLGLAAAILCADLLLGLQADVPGIDPKKWFWWEKLCGQAASLMAGLLLVTAAGCLYLNFNAITEARRLPLCRYGEAVLQSLPSSGGVVLADEPWRLASFQAAVAKQGQANNWVAINTAELRSPDYRQWLGRKHPESRLAEFTRWDKRSMMAWLSALQQAHRVYYLHRSFGGCFEPFYLQPQGIAYELKSYPPKVISPPRLTPEIIAQTEAGWEKALSRGIRPPSAPVEAPKALKHLLLLTSASPVQTPLIHRLVAADLDGWGVELQMAGQLNAASNRFAQALAFAPENIAATINLESNSNLLTHAEMGLDGGAALESCFDTPQSLRDFLLNQGPIDAPSFAYVAGELFVRSGLPRQALQQFARANALAPKQLIPKLALARLSLQLGMRELSLSTLNDIRQVGGPAVKANATLDVELALLEARSWMQASNSAKAQAVLEPLAQQYATNTEVMIRVINAYAEQGNLTRALKLVAQAIEDRPSPLELLLLKADLLNRAHDWLGAVQTANQCLAITNHPAARFIQAGAYYQLGNLEACETNLQALLGHKVFALPAQKLLADIALRRQNTNLALPHL